MKSNARASSQNKNSSIIAKISDFVSLNAFVLMLLMLVVLIHQIYIVGSAAQRVENKQAAMIKYLKENVNKVYFLSASGMAMTVEKSEVSYTHPLFKSYIANEIIDKLISGNIVLSKNYKIVYASAEEIVEKNDRFSNFYKRFAAPDAAVLSTYTRALHRAIVEGRYPEYINVFEHKYTQYTITKPNEENGFRTVIVATLSLDVLVKSWIKELKQWDTRRIKMDVPFSFYIDVQKHVNIGNPFGIHFLTLNPPVLRKPTATQVSEKKR